MLKVLHSGDWHLGRFNGPVNADGENVRFLDICHCLDILIETAKTESPDLAIIAGDIFHSAKVWADRGLKETQTAINYIRELKRICPVVVLRGTPNHDGESQFDMLKTAFNKDEFVHIITEPQVVRILYENLGVVQIACLPGFDRGYFRAKNPGLSKEEENEIFTQAVEDMIIGLKAQCDSHSTTIFTSHYTISGCNMESGQTAFFSQYEPIVYPSTLNAANYDLACFGHIHRPQQLEGCKNTFYCGAVSQLNFNDEGQPRGFYIHTLYKDSPEENTNEFFPLPTVEFYTIRLKNEDVTEINAGNYDKLREYLGWEVADKIVRALYDCTDENNKAFNHALLEKQLYADGAFYVQEITPQKITITVDRRSMEADGTPEGNLVDYLADKGTEEKRIGELTELARPIIAEATAKATTERSTGLFMPVEIEVKNYRNYKAEKFSFEDIQFCTINGSNGVGKSSLFMDAMADALFEETREGELTGWISNSPEARSGAIKFTFKLGDKLYRVTRTRTKSGKATLNISEFVDGEWFDRSKEKLRDTQAEIINIIGMDSLTLKACALIMQDQYGLFLQADKEARMNILGNILGLGIYEDMEELAAVKATDTNRRIRELLTAADLAVTGLPKTEELETRIQTLDESKKSLEAQTALKQENLNYCKNRLDKQLEAAERLVKLNSRLDTLNKQKATKESARTAQTIIYAEAEKTLQEADVITQGVKEYNALLEKEKELIPGKASYDSDVSRRNRTKVLVNDLLFKKGDCNRKKQSIESTIEALEQELEQEPELEAKHKDYIGIAARIKSMTEAKEGYEEKEKAVQLIKSKMAVNEADYNIKKSLLESAIANYKAKTELLKDSGCPIAETANCKFLADAVKAKEQLAIEEENRRQLDAEYTVGTQTLQNALCDAQKDLDEDLYNPKEFDALWDAQSRLSEAEKEYTGLELKRKELKIQNDRLKEVEETIDEVLGEIQTNKATLDELDEKIKKAEGIDAEIAEVRKNIEFKKHWVEEEKQLPAARERSAAALSRMTELETEIEEIKHQITEVQLDIAADKLRSNELDALQTMANATEAEIKSLRAAAENISIQIGGLQEKLEQARSGKKKAEELQAKANELGATAAGYEELKKAFSQDGIPHNIIRSIIPIFEATATNILGQMSGGKMNVEFVTEKVLKSNNKKEVTALDIIINDCDTGRLPYMSRSGGERVKAALSVILALSEIKSSKAGIQLGFLFVDEPPFLDQQGIQAYCDALEAIQNRYGNLKVMAITHDESFKARFPQSVTVYKDENGSHVMEG